MVGRLGAVLVTMANHDKAAHDDLLAYSCPECHTIFRVPRECMGKQVECPSCAGVVVISKEEEMAPVSNPVPPQAPRPANQFRRTEEIAEEEDPLPRAHEWKDRKEREEVEERKVDGTIPEAGASAKETRRVRRKVKKIPLEEPKEFDWEKDEVVPASSSSAVSRQMVIIGALALLILIAGGAALILTREVETDSGSTKIPENTPPLEGLSIDPPTGIPGGTELKFSGIGELQMREFLVEIKSVVEGFLGAPDSEEMMKFTRGGEILELRIRDYYQEHPHVPFTPRTISQSGQIIRSGDLWAVDVVLPDFTAKAIALQRIDGRFLVDWESWVGYSEVSWEEFQETRPRESKLFRILCSPVVYYNFDFMDDRKWRSFRIQSPDREHTLYAYVARFSPMERVLLPPDRRRGMSLAVTVKLRYPGNAESANQVLIEEVVHAGWVTGNNPKPGPENP